MLVLGLTFGPCIVNKVIAIVKSCLEAVHLMFIRDKYEPVNTDEDSNFNAQPPGIRRVNEQNKQLKEKGGIVIDNKNVCSLFCYVKKGTKGVAQTVVEMLRHPPETGCLGYMAK